MNKDLLKKKAEGVVDREASESDFDPEHREKALEKLEKAIEERQVKRFQDLKNKANAILSKIAEKEDVEFYD